MSITAFINNLKELPCKAERFAAGVSLMSLIILQQHVLQGFDHMSWFAKVGVALWYLWIPFAIDHDRRITKSMQNLWISAIVANLVVLPISFAQPYTVGFHIIASSAFVVSMVMMDSWYNIQESRRTLSELNDDISLYEYEEMRFVVGVLVIVGTLLGFVSDMEPMIVATFSFGILIYIAVEMGKIEGTYKSYIYSERNRIEREEQEARAKELEKFMNINDEEYYD